MKRISKNEAITLVCCFRQAERSLAFAVSSPTEWPEFLAFYDAGRKANVSNLVRELSCLPGGDIAVPLLSELLKPDIRNAVIIPANFLLNRWRRRWTLHPREVAFLHSTLEQVFQVTLQTDRPTGEMLIALRMDCYGSCSLLHSKLIGLPELEKAMSIEHFNQSDYRPHFSYDGQKFSNVEERSKSRRAGSNRPDRLEISEK